MKNLVGIEERIYNTLLEAEVTNGEVLKIISSILYGAGVSEDTLEEVLQTIKEGVEHCFKIERDILQGRKLN